MAFFSVYLEEQVAAELVVYMRVELLGVDETFFRKRDESPTQENNNNNGKRLRDIQMCKVVQIAEK